MAQQLKELDVLPETLSLVPTLKSVVDNYFTPAPGELDTIFWLPCDPHTWNI